MLQTLRRIQDRIPASDLCIRWDLIGLAAAIDYGVDMGFYICYGDIGHVHFVQPSDVGLRVDIANTFIRTIGPISPVAYVHMPVPRYRTDSAYFLPLKSLHTEKTESFLGAVHTGDESSSRKRLEAAQAVFLNVLGISTECDMGRTLVKELGSTLDKCAALTM